MTSRKPQNLGPPLSKGREFYKVFYSPEGSRKFHGFSAVVTHLKKSKHAPAAAAAEKSKSKEQPTEKSKSKEAAQENVRALPDDVCHLKIRVYIVYHVPFKK